MTGESCAELHHRALNLTGSQAICHRQSVTATHHFCLWPPLPLLLDHELMNTVKMLVTDLSITAPNLYIPKNILSVICIIHIHILLT